MKVILWDIDGTILNTGGAGVAPLINAFKKYTRIEPVYDRNQYSGLTDHQIVNSLLSQNLIESKIDLINTIISEYETHLPEALFGGKVVLLNDYHVILNDIESSMNITNAIATGNTLAGATAKLESVNLLNEFKYLFCSDDLIPRSLIIKNAMNSFPTGTEFCVIGDTPHDIEAAHANNVPILSVASGAYKSEDLLKFEPRVCLDKNWTLEELRSSLGRIFSEKDY